MSRTQQIYQQHYHTLCAKTDRMFLIILALQWVVGIIFAVFISPLSWDGIEPSVHIHVYAAIFLGGVLFSLPAVMIFRNPGASSNQTIVAISQILFSSLFIHLTGGRLETHFHIFGSLALLAFYRNWRPIVVGSVLVFLDHLLRGYFFPLSVYGVTNAGIIRAIEHAAWVIFEDVFLIYSIRVSVLEMWEIAKQQATLEGTLQTVETLANQRTKQLEQERAFAIHSAKLASLGEIAGGLAHEINTPLGALTLYAQEVGAIAERNQISQLKDPARHILILIERISTVVQNLRRLVKGSEQAHKRAESIQTILDDTLSLCQERFRSHGIELSVAGPSDDILIFCVSQEISQVLLNLLSNAYDAVILLPKQNRWVRIEVSAQNTFATISIVDCGNGISKEVQQQLMQPFFSTKDSGKGIGLGLSVAKRILENHGGSLDYDPTSLNTRFTISIPVYKELKPHEYI